MSRNGKQAQNYRITSKKSEVLVPLNRKALERAEENSYNKVDLRIT